MHRTKNKQIQKKQKDRIELLGTSKISLSLWIQENFIEFARKRCEKLAI